MTVDEQATEFSDFGAGRVCEWPECDTVLSRYNDSDRCSFHPHTRILLRPQGF